MPPLSVNTSVSIKIIDVDDNDPKFTKPLYNGVVKLNADIVI